MGQRRRTSFRADAPVFVPREQVRSHAGFNNEKPGVRGFKSELLVKEFQHISTILARKRKFIFYVFLFAYYFRLRRICFVQSDLSLSR